MQTVETVTECYLKTKAREISDLKKEINQATQSCHIKAITVNALDKILHAIEDENS